jgi:hypothetical protein
VTRAQFAVQGATEAAAQAVAKLPVGERVEYSDAPPLWVNTCSDKVVTISRHNEKLAVEVQGNRVAAAGWMFGSRQDAFTPSKRASRPSRRHAARCRHGAESGVKDPCVHSWRRQAR